MPSAAAAGRKIPGAVPSRCEPTVRRGPDGCYRRKVDGIGSSMRQVEDRATDRAEDQDWRDRWTGRLVRRLRRGLLSIVTFSAYALIRFNRDGCFAASGALSYTTLVSLVPLGVI